MNGNIYACVLWPGSTTKRDNFLFFSRILVVVCGGLRWFACIVSGFTAYRPNSGGDLWWFAVMCGGFGGLRWFVVVYGGLR